MGVVSSIDFHGYRQVVRPSLRDADHTKEASANTATTSEASSVIVFSFHAVGRSRIPKPNVA